MGTVELHARDGSVRGIALFDDEDAELVARYRWCMNGSGYAVRGEHYEKGVRLKFMHHEIIGRPPPGMCTDHVNGNRLDNRRANVRHATYSENRTSQLRLSTPRGTVNFHKSRQRWRAVTAARDGRRHLGYFSAEAEARACIEQYYLALG